jgi:hypothetical protein
MPGNRKKAEKSFLEDIEELTPGSPNAQMYRDIFASWSDKEFDEFMKGIEEDRIWPAIIMPNLAPYKLDIGRNLKLAEKWNHKLFERLWIDDGGDVPPYLTNEKYLIIDMPLRRQAQMLTKKISIPEHNKSIDDLSGQPTGASKGSRLSFPETQLLAAHQLDHSLTEFLNARGGDQGAFNAMNTMISRSGAASLKAIEPYSTGVKATETVKTMLTCMHLETTL